jgi:endonuclease/exonuclease/phosphatase family metal-dependent hydrolase
MPPRNLLCSARLTAALLVTCSLLACLRRSLRKCALLLGFVASAAHAVPFEITVMTQNLYFGADLGPVVTAPTVPALIGAVTAAYTNVVATDPAARMVRIADEITAAKPDVVGLQEAVIWRTRTPSVLTGSPGPQVVAFDFVQLLLDRLGPTYALAVKTQGLDATAPGLLGGILSDIRLTDQRAILVRTDRPADQFKLLATGSADFAAFLSAPIVGGGTVNDVRNYAFVDVSVSGAPVRIATTHLEPAIAAIQVLQGNELIAALAGVPFPEIVMGDFNSNADGSGTATYANMLAAGFNDAWLEKGVGPGFTAHQAANLLNFPSALDERIDVVFHRGALQTVSVDVIGEEPGDRIVPPGLWPSDHAGVLATFSVVAEPNVLVLIIVAFVVARRACRQ